MSARQPCTVRRLLQTASIQALILGATLIAMPQIASAQSTNVWDGTDTTGNGIVTGGSGTWTVDGTNWTTDAGTTNGRYDPSALLIFRDTGGTVTVDNASGPLTAPAGLHFASNGYRVQGDAIGFGGGSAAIRVGDGAAAGAASTATIASALTGATRLIKTDLGTLTLTAASTIATGVDVRSGTLLVEGAGTVSSGEVKLGAFGPATLAVRNGGSLTAVSTTVGGSLDGGSNADADGTLLIAGAGTQVSAGRLLAAFGDGSVGTISVTGGGVLNSASGEIGNRASTGTVTVSGAGSRWNSAGLARLGTSAANNSRGSLTILDGGVLTLAANSVLQVSDGSDLRVSGAGSRIDGVPTSRLELERSTTGGTVVLENGGVASVGSTEFGNSSGLTIRSGGRLEVAGGSTNFNQDARVLVTGAGSRLTTGGNFNFIANGVGADVVFDDGAIVTSTANVGSSLAFRGSRRLIVRNGAQFNLTGGTAANLTLDGGTLDVTDASVSLSGNLLFSDTSATSTAIFRNSNFSANNVALLGANARLIVGAEAGQAAGAVGSIDFGDQITITQPTAALVLNYTGPGLTVGTAFSGTGGRFTHLAGETRLTGMSNQWRGITDLTGGSLAVDNLFGDGSGPTTAMNVSGGATLSGRGTVGGVVIVADGIIRPGGDALDATGTLLGGNAIGNLTFSNSLALGAASRLAFQLGAPNTPGVGSDLVTVGGNLTLDGTLNVTNAGGFGPGLYRLIDYGGTLINNGLAIGTTPAGFAASDLTVQTGVARQVNLLVGSSPLSATFWDGGDTADNGVVDGGTGTWTTTRTNWTNADGSRNGAYDRTRTLIFAGTGGIVTVDNGTAPGVDNPQVTIIDTNQFAPTGMQFASTGYRIQGGDISFGGGESIATIRVGDGTAAGAAINATIASNLILANRIDKTDLGTLTLTGQNLMLPGGGRTRVQGGTLEIAGGGQLLSNGLEIALLGQGATFRVTGAGSIASVGIGIRTGFVNNGPGTVEVLNGGLLRDSAFGGNNFGAGSLVRISGAGSLIDLANNSISQGALVVENGGIARVAPFAFTSTGSLIVRSGGVIERSRGDGSFGSGTWRIPNGLIQGAGTAFSSAFNLGIAPATPSDPGARFVVEDGAAVTVNVNTDSGLGFQGPMSTLDVRSGAAFTLTGGTNAGLQTENAVLTVDNATFSIGGALTAGQRFGNTSILLRNADFSARAISLNAATDRLAIGADAGEAAGGIRRFDVGTIALNNAATTLTLNHDAVDFALASVLNGTGTIRHMAGDTRLTGDSRFFSGQTIVTGGVLRVDNLFGDAGQRMTVSGGATLSGGGTIGGSVTVADGTIRPGGDPLAPPAEPEQVFARVGVQAAAAPALLGGDAVGTLTIGGPLVLGSGSRLAFQLGAPNTPGIGSDLINVTGNLTLDGTVDVADAGGFGIGLYRLINYGGMLTNNGLLIGSVPEGFSGGDLAVQTSVAQQVNLIVAAPVPTPTSFSFWDGADTTGNRAVDGGTGTWTTTGRNWTVSTGEANGVYDPTQLLIFSGTGGVATVDTGAGAVTVDRGLQFATGAYRVEGGALTLGTNAITLRVGDGTAAGMGISATIASDLVGGASIEKTDLGTLILTGRAEPLAGTTITNGTLQIGAAGASGSIGGDIANNAALVFARSGTLDHAGAVSGSGTLEQRGPGTLTLSGIHSYSGATTVTAGTLINSGTIVSATTVLAAGALTNAGTIGNVTSSGTGTNTGTMGALTNIAGSFTNSGTLNEAVTNSAGATFATTATLNGGLTNNGTARIGGVVNGAIDNRAGTVTATAATTGVGAFTQSAAATLNLGGFALAAGSLAGDGAVQLGAGTLTTGGSNASTAFAGIVSGTGRIVKQGTGQLTLTGANTYSGGTTVAAGTLAGTAQSLQGAIVNDGRVRFDQVTAGTYAGALSGAGQLEKAGGGRLDLTGTGLMSGATLVSAGELAVNGSLARSVVTVATGARLAGAGTVGGIVALVGSTVAPGNLVGTLNVQGNVSFAPGSTFAVEVQGATADRLAATGTAQLGGTLAITAVAGPYTFSAPYVLLSAAGGRTGTFDAATGLAGFGPGIRPTVSYDATTVTLRLDPNAIGPILGNVALTPNQRSAQVRFDAAIAGGTTNAAPFFPVFNLPLVQLPTALDALSGEVHATASRLVLDDERMIRTSTLDQLRSARSGSGVWGAAIGNVGRIASDGNAARVTRDSAGFISGIDTGGDLDDARGGWRIGAQAHYLRTTFDIADRASSGSLNRTGGGVYGSVRLGGFAIRSGATLASVEVKTSRGIAATGFAEQGKVARTGTAFQAFGEIGYTVGDGRAAVEPFAGLAVSRLKIGAITEAGGVSAVSVRARNDALTIADVGLHGHIRLTPADETRIDLNTTLAARRTLGDRTLVSDIAFASSPSLDFGIATIAQDRTAFLPEVSVEGELGRNLTVHLSYSGLIGRRTEDHGVRVGMRFAF